MVSSQTWLSLYTKLLEQHQVAARSALRGYANMGHAKLTSVVLNCRLWRCVHLCVSCVQVSLSLPHIFTLTIFWALLAVSAGAEASADATATVRTFFDDWNKGKKRAPRPSECEAAATASASAFAGAKGGDAMSAAKAKAEASGFAWGSKGWKNKFTEECKASASASASAEAVSEGGKRGRGGVASEYY